MRRLMDAPTPASLHRCEPTYTTATYRIRMGYYTTFHPCLQGCLCCICFPLFFVGGLYNSHCAGLLCAEFLFSFGAPGGKRLQAHWEVKHS